METFELLEPLRLSLTVAGGHAPAVVVDVLIANDAIGAASERAKGTSEPTAWLVELRPWLASQLGVKPEDLALNQVFDFAEKIGAMVEADTEARKKKRLTIAYSPPPSPESPPISEGGTAAPNGHGSETLPA